MTRSLESAYLDPHHIGKDDEDYTTGFERTSLDRRMLTVSTQRVPASGTTIAGRTSFRYRGLLLDGRQVVWTCQHEHDYRDGHVYQWRLVHGPRGAALTCAQDELAARSAVAQ